MAFTYEMKAYQEQINLTLLTDIICFVDDTANFSWREMREKCIFPLYNQTQETLPCKYGFGYLGELLERYEDRFGMTLRDLRAIALALGYTQTYLTKEMFVGTQREDFMKQVWRNAAGDIYLTGALFLLHEGQNTSVSLANKLLQHPYTQVEELIFALSILPDFDHSFRSLKGQLLSLLTSQRRMPVLENTWIIDRLIVMVRPLLKTIRTKDMSFFRALCKMPSNFIRPGSKEHKLLLDSGYTALEISYANIACVMYRSVNNALCLDSLVTEKLVIELFRLVISSEEAMPEAVYPQLSILYERYQSLPIKCYEAHTLQETLRDERLRNAETALWLSQHLNVFHEVFLSFDILDPRWDVLAAKMEKGTYYGLFEASLSDHMEPSDIRARIERCDALLGESYLATYGHDNYNMAFPLLVNKGIFDLWQVFCDALGNGENKEQKCWFRHIRSYLKDFPSVHAFLFYQQFFPKHGFEGLEKYFSHPSFFLECFISGFSSYSDTQLKINQSFLDEAARRTILYWLEAFYFSQDAEHYLRFAAALLSEEEIAALLEPSDRRSLFEQVITDPDMKPHVSEKLKKIYLTEVEQQAEQDAKNAAKLEADQKAQQYFQQKVREIYAQLDDGSFNSLDAFLNRFSKRFDDYSFIVNLVREQIPGHLAGCQYALCQSEVASFLSICNILIENNALTLEEVKQYFSMIKEDRPHDADCH